MSELIQVVREHSEGGHLAIMAFLRLSTKPN